MRSTVLKAEVHAAEAVSATQPDRLKHPTHRIAAVLSAGLLISPIVVPVRLMRSVGWKAETFASAQEFLDRPRQMNQGPAYLHQEGRFVAVSGVYDKRVHFITGNEAVV